MRILLPPSEGKTWPDSGPALELRSLSFPELTDARRRVLEALIDVSGRDDAAGILKVGKRVMSEVQAQRELRDMPCAPAYQVYTGVLFQAAQLHGGDEVMIFSGLFGVTTAEDLIPAYRLSMNTSLPGIGSLKTFWRRELTKAGFGRTNCVAKHGTTTDAAIDDSMEVAVDMRSGAYQVTTPRGQWWDLRVLDSQGKVVTHAAKHYRGLLTRALLDTRHEAQEGHPGISADIREHEESIDVARVARSLGNVEIANDGLRHHITLRLQES
ncbi:YaaA family protein [Bifidobacterium crudilactis]|uniref:YaaA family protein n=1 Tax=Bifidobacterium crudilactis TaxID=327277 RepID=UPI002F3502BB|nr:peroxide stress protein YaaA [Bifidobacterium crudilactis]